MDWIIQGITTYAAEHFYISPFWYWCSVGAGAIAAVSALGWYFPVLRSLTGAIVFSILAGLWGYRRGETDAEEHQKFLDRNKPQPRDDKGGWSW